MADQLFKNYLDRGNGHHIAIQADVHRFISPGYYKYYEDNGEVHYQEQELSNSKIILDEDQIKILKRISDFWELREEYLKRKFPHKRGILLYGPPGTGKTTILRSVIDDVINNRDGLILELKNTRDLIDAFRAIHDIEVEARPLVVVAEDLEEWNNDGLTDVMDGIVRLDYVLFLATTNSINRVSTRLKDRPSRFDEKIEIGFPSVGIRREFISGIFGDIGKVELDKMVESTEGISIAHIKELLIRKFIYKEDVDGVIETFKLQCNNAEEEFPEEKNKSRNEIGLVSSKGYNK
jgi:SpoVK/Ycf46/Vps4 family AAA+-type ATPase